MTGGRLADSPHYIAGRLAVLGYLMLFLGCLFGITAIIGAIVNHTHLHKTAGTTASSHIKLQLITFWTLAAVTACTIAFTDSGFVKALIIVGIAIWVSTLTCGSILLFARRAVPFVDN